MSIKILNLQNIEKNDPKVKEDLKFFFEKNINNFTNLVSNPNLNNNIDWYLSLAFSRNTLVSDLYKKFCNILYLKYLNEQNVYIEKIIVESIEEKKTIENYISKKLNIKFLNKNNKTKHFINIILYFSYQIFYRFFQKILSRLSGYNKINKNHKIILIDTYVHPGFYTNDRYYNNLLDFTDKKNNIFFLPTLAYTSITELFYVYRQLRQSENHYILREDYITYFDIIYSILHIFRIRLTKINDFNFSNIDFSLIIKSELTKIKGDNIAIEGWINYFFFKRAKNKNLNILKLIDWWENQSTDKGMNLGFKKYYPYSKSLGYLGYAPRFLELQLIPSEYECRHHLIPDAISVHGKSLIDSISQLNKNLKVLVAPAFRYNYLWNINKKFNNKITNVLVALPILIDESILIIQLLVKLIKKLDNYNIKFYVKTHPTISQDLLSKKINASSKFIIQTDEKINSLLKLSDLVISSRSIVCLESIAIGIPTLIYENDNIITFNPIPKKIPNILWKSFKNYDELEKNFKYFSNNFNNIVSGNLNNNLMNEYFEKTNFENVKKFLS